MYLVCPLCGKLAHLNRFNPEEYDDDVKLVEMRGLGRGRGFEVTSRVSALDDEELMDVIATRCRVILKVIGEGGEEEVRIRSLEEGLDGWRKEALWRRETEKELRAEIEELQESVDGLEEEMDDLLARVNGVLEEEYGDLDSAVAALITAYDEAQEEAED